MLFKFLMYQSTFCINSDSLRTPSPKKYQWLYSHCLESNSCVQNLRWTVGSNVDCSWRSFQWITKDKLRLNLVRSIYWLSALFLVADPKYGIWHGTDASICCPREKEGSQIIWDPERMKILLSEIIRFTIIIYDGHFYAKATSAIFYSHLQHKVEDSCKYSQLLPKSETSFKDLIIQRTLFIIS